MTTDTAPSTDIPATAPHSAPTAARAPSAARRLGWSLLLLVLIAASIALVAWAWSISRAQRDEAAHNQQRLSLLERQLGNTQTELAALNSSNKQLETSLYALRAELVALDERTTQTESAAHSQPAEPDVSNAITGLALDQVELLLTLAAQRAQHDADIPGARELYTQADAILARLPAADFAELRQTLATELGTLASLTRHPRSRAIAQIDALFARMDALDATAANSIMGAAANEKTPPPAAIPRTWWQRALADWIKIHPTTATAPAPAIAETPPRLRTLRHELARARASLVRTDTEAAHRALQQADDSAKTLPDTAQYQPLRDELQALRQQSLVLDIPVPGNTLEQLRTLRDTH